MVKRKGLIKNYFKPSMYVRTFKDINVTQLKRQGIKVFICDLDNTLVPHFTRLPNKDVLSFFAKLKAVKIKIVIMSNNTTARTKKFAEKAGVTEYYGNARKPFKFIAKKITAKHKRVKPSEFLIMGDQIIMDILVANRMKWESILVQPLVNTDYEMNLFNLFLEKRIYKNLEKKNILKKDVFDDGGLGKMPELL